MLCYAGRDSLAIDSSGNLRPCSVYPEIAGNIFKSTIKNIWENSSLLCNIRSISIDDIICKTCEYVEYCDNIPHCHAHAIYNNEDKMIPYNRMCERAQMYKQTETRKGVNND